MTPIFQTRFSTAEGEKGNCMTACVASLLDLPIEKVPYFFDFPDFWDAVFAFLYEQGCEYNGCLRPDADGSIGWDGAPGIDGYFIVAGPSPRWPGARHAVIYKDGRMIHDPHPDGTGILYVEEVDDIRRRISA